MLYAYLVHLAYLRAKLAEFGFRLVKHVDAETPGDPTGYRIVRRVPKGIFWKNVEIGRIMHLDESLTGPIKIQIWTGAESRLVLHAVEQFRATFPETTISAEQF